MKVAVVGNGHVGLTVFRELQAFREIRELVLVGRNGQACQAEAEDYLDALPLRLDKPGLIMGGGLDLAEGADILIYTAGPSIKGVEDRLTIADENIRVLKEVFDQLDKYAPKAIVVVVSNPLDVVTTAITKYTNRPANKVIGTGTLLDTARLHKFVSWAFQVPTENVGGFVLGEHGASSVVIGSSITVMNMRSDDYLKVECNGKVPASKDDFNEDVRDAGFRIFRGKGYTSAGVAAAVARIVFDIVNDIGEIIPVSTVLHGEYGVDGYAMSVPCQVGRNGVVNIRKLVMTDSEQEQLKHSAEVIRKACSDSGVLE